MSLLSHCPADAGWDVEILATDISTQVLQRARAATWPIAKADEVPGAYLKRFMLRGRGEHQGQMKAGPEIRSIVKFQQVNLNAERVPVAGPFELDPLPQRADLLRRPGANASRGRLLSLLTARGPPVPGPRREPQRLERPPPQRDPHGLHPGTGVSPRTLSVLVVDDSAVVRQAATGDSFPDPGIVVTVAADPYIALDKMGARGPT